MMTLLDFLIVIIPIIVFIIFIIGIIISKNKSGFVKSFFIFCIILFIVFFLVFFFTFKKNNIKISFNDLHDPGPKDIFFRGVAIDFGLPQLCEKVSPKAYSVAGFSPRGTQISYWRSECFFEAATRTKTIQYCNEVIPLNKWNPLFFAWHLDGSFYSKGNCIAGVRGNYEGDFSGSPALTDEIMQEMGYTKEVLGNMILSNELDYKLRQRYLNPLFTRQDFLDKVNKLPNYDEAINRFKVKPAATYEILYQIMAIELGSETYCTRISPNTYFPGDNVHKALVRSQCFMYIAVNKGSTILCNNIEKPIVNSDTFFTPENCEAMISQYQYPGDSYHGPTNLTYDALKKLLQELGYPIDVIEYADYEEFYSKLLFPTQQSSDQSITQHWKNERENFKKKALLLSPEK